MPIFKIYLGFFVLGFINVFGFAPFNLFFVPILSFSLFLVCLFYSRSRHSRVSVCFQKIPESSLHRITRLISQYPFIAIFIFYLGFFLAGIYWIEISLHQFGGMPLVISWICVILLSSFLSIFPSTAIYLGIRSRSPYLTTVLCLCFAEWGREWLFTGFPWLLLGYSQINSPLSGYAPIFGVLGVSVMTLTTILLLVKVSFHFIPILHPLIPKKDIHSSPTKNIIFIFFIWSFGFLLGQIEWTKPDKGYVNVALIQGNIPQDLKWQEELIERTTQHYFRLIGSTQADIIVLPETAISQLIDLDAPYPTILLALQTIADSKKSAILFGVITARSGRYYNSVIAVSPHQKLQIYDKHHLVPFGEFIPLKSLIARIYDELLNMPLSDLSRGVAMPLPFTINSHKLAVNICYEDVFGNEIIHQFPQAELILNLSNDAWYGDSIAAEQHLQFSQMRAIETGRMAIRATNTGVTAVIDTKGRIIEKLPQFSTRILESKVQLYRGETPYVFWGNRMIVGICFGLWFTHQLTKKYRKLTQTLRKKLLPD